MLVFSKETFSNSPGGIIFPDSQSGGLYYFNHISQMYQAGISKVTLDAIADNRHLGISQTVGGKLH